MYYLTILNPDGLRIGGGRYGPHQVAQFILQTSVGGMEYDGNEITVRHARVNEHPIQLDEIAGWIESYLNLDIAGCC